MSYAAAMTSDECVLDDEGRCVRTDDAHGWEYEELRPWGAAETRRVRTTCQHLPAHVVPVESGGRVVAHLCITCDQQLP